MKEKKIETFTHGELVEKFEAEITSRISNHTTSIYVTNEDKSSFTHKGSGTFVTFGDGHYLLSAAHVIEEVKKSSYFGVVLSDKSNVVAWRLEYFEDELIKGSKYNEFGPDLGLLKIPSRFVGSIEAYKSFISLERHNQLSQQDQFNLGVGVFATVGFPELKVNEIHEGSAIRKEMVAKIILTEMHEYYELDEIDYYKLSMDGPVSDIGLATYEGMSGGGVWQIIVGKPNGVLTLGEIIFRGVIFYQLRQTGNTRPLVCHGYKSLYRLISNKLLKRMN